MTKERGDSISISEWDDGHRFAKTVYEREHYKESLLLGPDGKPLRYEPRQKLGFDLRPKGQRR